MQEITSTVSPYPQRLFDQKEKESDLLMELFDSVALILQITAKMPPHKREQKPRNYLALTRPKLIHKIKIMLGFLVERLRVDPALGNEPATSTENIKQAVHYIEKRINKDPWRSKSTLRQWFDVLIDSCATRTEPNFRNQ